MMAAYLLDKSVLAICPHGGSVAVQASVTQVKINGQPILVFSDLFTISGCPLVVPGLKPQPCVALRWLVPAKRVRVNGQPALLQDSSGLCQSVEQIPQGAPNILMTQTQVRGI